MNVIFNHHAKKLYFTEIEKNITISADSIVRNNDNKLRSLDNPNEVIYTATYSKYEKTYPYMPMPLPEGVYHITGAEQLKDQAMIDIFGEYIIYTDAQPEVEIWDLDFQGGYREPTGEFVKDTGYLIHYSAGPYTLGCIATHDKTDQYLAFELCVHELYHNKTMRLTVV